jgi:hypothetical protein
MCMHLIVHLSNLKSPEPIRQFDVDINVFSIDTEFCVE